MRITIEQQFRNWLLTAVSGFSCYAIICDKPVHIDARDKLIRFTFTGAATNRKLIDAVVLELLAQ